MVDTHRQGTTSGKLVKMLKDAEREKFMSASARLRYPSLLFWN
jgi:hypothetical protein